MKKNLILLIVLLGTALSINAQSTYFPLGHDAYHYLDRLQVLYGDHLPNHFPTVKPWTRKSATEILDYVTFENPGEMQLRAKHRLNHQYIMKEGSEWNEAGDRLAKKPVLKHFYKNATNFLYLKGENYSFKLDPYIDLQVGADDDIYRFINTRGLELRGWLGKKVGFYTQFSDNQAKFNQYTNEYVFENLAIPGEGRYSVFKQGTGQRDASWDFLRASGYLTFSPIEEMQFVFGTDHNFIGDGKRSLILSDFGNRYPFLKIDTRFGKFQYVNLFAELTQSFTDLADQEFQKKYMALHHLTFQATKWLSFGLFESVIFDATNRGLRLEYFNPVILYRYVEHNAGSPDNVLLGFDWRAKLHTSGLLYGQIILDEFNFSSFLDNDKSWKLKYGYQVGLKWIDIAQVVNLDLNIEYNRVRPFTYSHGNPANVYGHFNMPLSHPLGSSFSEVIAELRYKPIDKLHLRLNTMIAKTGASFEDGVDVFGSNIFADPSLRLGEINQEVAQGNTTDIFLLDLEASYMIRHNISFDAGITYRKSSPTEGVERRTTYPYLGLRFNAQRKKFLF